ncbi:hypothetical protein P8A18_34210 (plasmid) [Streptomyces castrisilvae]|uniref:Helicase-associated domain-containing protein n=1 Tax=Streptomyces castrisilvae TaxID=3033811 RepID=A0ABY9HX05_9ACTN|nr:hypothetical protein [Streptomyces sp. Mut1]WLQ38579.1 hypothetical protein P8A18_34210 [Streptomyces sp. Mut1]
MQQRGKARSGQLSAHTLQELTVLDPWWNPPWPYTWHRTWQQYRATISRNEPVPDALQRWAAQQRTRRHTLHPHQQRLLTRIGITG